MPLRKGNVVADTAAAKAETPAFDSDSAPALDPTKDLPPPPPVQQAAAPPPPQVNPVSTAPTHQQGAVNAQATQAAPAPAPITPTVVAPIPPTQLPATAPIQSPVATSGIQGELNAAGFDGLEFGFGAFPIVTLQTSGQFETSEGGVLGNSFNCILLGSVSKYICKNDQKKPNEDFFYSYDRAYSTQGEPVADIIAAWEARGWKHEWKKYLDVQAQMVTEDEDNGALVLLSVPPTSVARFSGYVATILGRHGKQLGDVVTQCALGDKVTKVKYPFHPWSFQFLRDA